MTVATRAKSAAVRTFAVPQSLVHRGSEVDLLVEEVDTDTYHAFPLSKIEWIEVDWRHPRPRTLPGPA